MDYLASKTAKKRTAPSGRAHLHFLMRGSKEIWVVRTRRSQLCGTARCRLVYISYLEVE